MQQCLLICIYPVSCSRIAFYVVWGNIYTYQELNSQLLHSKSAFRCFELQTWPMFSKNFFRYFFDKLLLSISLVFGPHQRCLEVADSGTQRTMWCHRSNFCLPHAKQALCLLRIVRYFPSHWNHYCHQIDLGDYSCFLQKMTY